MRMGFTVKVKKTALFIFFFKFFDSVGLLIQGGNVRKLRVRRRHRGCRKMTRWGGDRAERGI